MRGKSNGAGRHGAERRAPGRGAARRDLLGVGVDGEGSALSRAVAVPEEEPPPPPPLPFPEDDGVEYTPPPPPMVVLPELLRAAYYDEPGFVLRPFAVAGPLEPRGSMGVVGRMTRADEKIAVRVGAPLAYGYFGVPRSGKTYAMGNLIEVFTQRTPYLNAGITPGCAVVLYLRGSPQLLDAVYPNRDEADLEKLVCRYGSLPQGLQDVVWLTWSGNVARLRKEHPHLQVHGVRLSCAELGVDNLRTLLGIEPDDTSAYARQVNQLLAELPPGFEYEDLWEGAHQFPFRDEGVRRQVVEKLRAARGWIDDRRRLRDLVKPGRMLVVDLRGAWLSEEEMARLCGVVIDVLALPTAGQARAFPLTLFFDEAHHFVIWPRLYRQLERLLRERRHLGVGVVLGSQDPLSVPASFLGQLDGIGVFRHGSRRWIRRLWDERGAFRALTAEMTAQLVHGQYFFWSDSWEGGDGELEDNLVLIQGRPRLSWHGPPGRY